MRFSAYLSVLATSTYLATASNTLGHATNDSVALAETFSAADIYAQAPPETDSGYPATKPAKAPPAANHVATKGMEAAAETAQQVIDKAVKGAYGDIQKSAQE